MTCYSPNVGILWTYYDQHELKRKFQYLSKVNKDHLRSEADRLSDIDFANTLYLHHGYKRFNTIKSEYMQVRCGECIGCHLDKSLEWAQRCIAESKYYDPDQLHFVTLTYDDDHLPVDRSLMSKSDFGAIKKVLLERVYERFHVRGVRFYMCAEYGSLNNRPHYHIIFFGLPLDDLELFDRKRHIYRSAFLEDWWPNGFVGVGKVSAQSVAYVARYCLKKQYGQGAKTVLDADGEYLPLLDEWTNMSLKPGIGRQFYEDMKDQIYITDSIPMKMGDRVIELKPASYYDRLFDIDEPHWSESVKQRRVDRAESKLSSQLRQTNLSADEILMNEARAKAEKIICLKRSFEEGT